VCRGFAGTPGGTRPPHDGSKRVSHRVDGFREGTTGRCDDPPGLTVEGFVARLRNLAATGEETDQLVDFDAVFKWVTQVGVRFDLVPIPTPYFLV